MLFLGSGLLFMFFRIYVDREAIELDLNPFMRKV